MTNEDITRMAREAGYTPINDYYTNGTVLSFSDDQIKKFATIVAAAEREACAKECDELAELNRQSPTDAVWQWEECAAAIRARSMK